MLVLIVYDITDNKRRNKLSKFLEGYGTRVQLSVFECFLSLKEMRDLYLKIKQRVKLDEDNVRFYWITGETITNTLTIGGEEPEPPPSYYLI